MGLPGKCLEVDAQHIAGSLRRERGRSGFLVTQEIQEAFEAVAQGGHRQQSLTGVSPTSIYCIATLTHLICTHLAHIQPAGLWTAPLPHLPILDALLADTHRGGRVPRNAPAPRFSRIGSTVLHCTLTRPMPVLLRRLARILSTCLLSVEAELATLPATSRFPSPSVAPPSPRHPS